MPPFPLKKKKKSIHSIQQSAALALGRLANYSDDLAEAVVQNEILPQLVYSLSEQNRFYKKSAAFCLRAVAKHSPALAQVRTYLLSVASLSFSAMYFFAPFFMIHIGRM